MRRLLQTGGGVPVRYLLSMILITAGTLAPAQDIDTTPEPAWFVRAIAERFSGARSYTFDGTIELARKNGEQAREVVGRYGVKVAVAPQGKFLLWVGDKQSPQYIVVCDGSRTWVYVPDTNQYVNLDALVRTAPVDPDDVFSSGVLDRDRNPIFCSSLIVPIMSRVNREATLVEMKQTDANEEPGDRQLRTLTVLSEKSEHTGQSITEMLVDPQTADVEHLEWSHSCTVGDEPRFAILTAELENLQLGGPIAPSSFVFNADGAQEVKELPIADLNGSALAGQPAPDFEFETRAHSKTHLSGLKGHPVLLMFSAPDCPPCGRQWTVLSELQRTRKDLDLTILQIGLDRSNVHRLYGVEFLPTLIAIDASGNVVRSLPGARDKAAVEEVLKEIGLPAQP